MEIIEGYYLALAPSAELTAECHIGSLGMFTIVILLVQSLVIQAN